MRTICAALAIASLIPGPGRAQVSLGLEKPVWGPRIALTTFVGFAPVANRSERWLFVGPAGSVEDEWDVDLAAGPAAGVALEARLIERFALVASGTYLSRGRTRERSLVTNQAFEHAGSNFVLAKAALAMRLREEISELQVHSLSGSVFVGPAWVRETPKSETSGFDAGLFEPLSYWGVNFGIDALIPLVWDGLTFQAGIEDFFFWWNDVELGRRNDLATGGAGQSFVKTDPSHNWVFRAGISFRFR